MDSVRTEEEVSAIIRNEEELEITINQLIAESVARSDISIQGSPEQIKDKYGVQYIDPEIVQESKNPPVVDPFLSDDFAWVIAFSFALPLFLCIVIAVFILGDIRSSADNLVYGILGTAVGIPLGLFVANKVKKRRDDRILKQEIKGGFVIWVSTHSPEQHQQVLKILKQHQSQHIMNIESPS